MLFLLSRLPKKTLEYGVRGWETWRCSPWFLGRTAITCHLVEISGVQFYEGRGPGCKSRISACENPSLASAHAHPEDNSCHQLQRMALWLNRNGNGLASTPLVPHLRGAPGWGQTLSLFHLYLILAQDELEIHPHHVAGFSEDPVLEWLGLQQWWWGQLLQKPDIKWHICLKWIDHSSWVCNLDTGQLLPIREWQGTSKLN